MARTTPVNAGYSIIQGVTRGTNVSEVDTWIEYKVLSQSIANNSSQVRAILYSQARRSADTRQENTPRQYGYVQIDGGTKYWLTTTFNYQNHAICKFADHTFTVVHNTNGTKTITISGDFDFSEYVGKYLTGGSASGTVTLPTIPQYATVTQTAQSKTETSITMTWVSDNLIDFVKYSIDNGTSWVDVGAVNSATGSYTISGLTANTTYQIKTQVRNKSSQLTSSSESLSVETYNYPYATVTPDFVLGNAVRVTFYNPLGRTFSFGLIANSQEITYESWTTNGTSYNGFNGAGTVSSLYASIPSAKTGTYYVKTTYEGHTITSSVHGTFSASESACRPTISSLSYEDTNSTTTAVTEDSSKIIQNKSTVRYTAVAIGQYSASISSVVVSVNGLNYSLALSGTNYVGGNAVINSAQDVEATVTVTDSRGYKTTASVNVTMLAWGTPSAIITLERQNNFYSLTHINVDASYSYLDGNNTITIQYRIKKTSESSYGAWNNLSDNVQSSFEADNLHEWNVQVKVTDRLGGTVTYNLTLAKGMPLIFFDRLRMAVGINCFPDTDESLFLNGVNINRDIMTAKLTANISDITATAFTTFALNDSIEVGNRLSLVNGGIKIGAGVSKIKVDAKMQIHTGSSVSTRYFIIVKNSYQSDNSNTISWVVAMMDGSINGELAIPPTLYEVSENDVIYLVYYLRTGDTIQGGSGQTYLTVEAVE